MRRGTVVATTAAAPANSPASPNAVRNPELWRIASPTIGPMPSPAYTATEKYDAASARRSAGLRSEINVIAATNSAASPAPVSPRRARRTGSESANP